MDYLDNYFSFNQDFSCDEQEEFINTGETGVYYHNITHDDMLNGDGLRVVLWLSGCSHKCKGCQNPQTWDPEGGIPLTMWDEQEFWSWLKKPWIQGATFSGGDPLYIKNRDYVESLCKRIKEIYPDKDIWLYTGYTLTSFNGDFTLKDEEDEFQWQGLKYIDVLVDGKFDCECRMQDIRDHKEVNWRGSSNQRVIDVNKTLEIGKIVCL